MTGTAMAGTDFTIFVINGDATRPSALTEVLQPAGYDVRTYSSPDTFFDRHDWTVPGCVLVELRIQDGLHFQQQLAGRRPIIFLAVRCSIEDCAQAMKAGAIDFLRKPADQYKLFDAIKRAKEQDVVIRWADAERKELAALERQLSPREKQVLCYVIAGWRNLPIAHALGIGLKTVKVHRGRVMKKMRASSVVELARLAAKISLQPVELPNPRVPTANVKRLQAKGAPRDKPHRQIKAANACSDFAEPEATLNSYSPSSKERQIYGYGPIFGLSSTSLRAR